MHNWYHSNVSCILLCTRHRFQCTVQLYTAHSPCFYLSLLAPLCLPFVPFLTPFHLLGTLLAVTESVHLGLRLLVNWPPLSQPFPNPSPLQIPRTPITQRLTKTTSGRIRRLLSGTVTWNVLFSILRVARFPLPRLYLTWLLFFLNVLIMTQEGIILLRKILTKKNPKTMLQQYYCS